MTPEINPAFRLVAPILAGATEYPERRAIATMDESVTYAQLAGFMENFARHLRLRGVNQGDRLALTEDHPMVMIVAALACAMLGCSWVVAREHALANKALRITHLLHTAPPPPADPRIARVAVSPAWLHPPPPHAAGVNMPLPGYRNPRDAWMIANSSGTTGAPKYMMLTDAIVAARLTSGDYSTTRQEPVFMCLFPPLSYPSMLPLLRTMRLGGTFIFGELLQLHGRLHIDSVMGSPNHFSNFLASAPAIGNRIEEAIIAGAPAGPEFFARSLQYFQNICYGYGSTECAMIAATTLRAGDVVNRPHVGTPMPGTEIQIVSDAGVVLANGKEGIVRVHSPGVVSGYIGEPGLSARVFRNGWFHPGDLGRINPDGSLSITGRADELINIGGSKVNPDIIEALANNVPGLMECACFAEPTAEGLPRMAAAIAMEPGTSLANLARELSNALRGKIAQAHMPRRLYALPAIPRNANGKIPRHELPSHVAQAPMAEVPMPE